MSEDSFWNYLRTLLPAQGHYTRIESHDTAPGFPDVHYTLEGVTGTIELKDAKKPGAKYPFRGQSGLRKGQRVWMRQQTDSGGLIFLALQCGDRVYILRTTDTDNVHDILHIMTEEDVSNSACIRWVKRHFTDAHRKALNDILQVGT
jgi:hypothetical protein